MSSIVDLLSSQLGPDAVQSISRQLGIDEGTAQQAIGAAIPMLTGGLAKNASQPGGAAALHQAVTRDHDGGLLDNVTDFLGQGGSSGMGAGILGHVFGGNQGNAASGLSKVTGLDSNKSGQLLMMLAPLVLAALGKLTNRNGLDSGGLASVLQQGNAQAQAQAPSGLGSILGNLLDSNNDGSVMDDVARMGGGLLGGLFDKR